MDFFSRQDQARKQTRRLLVWFTLAVLGVILAVHAATVLLLTLAASQSYEINPPWWSPELFFITTTCTLFVILCGSAWKSSQLSDGGRCVAESLGGQRIHPQTTDPAERRLLNVVEEMAIASGTPVPDVYLLDENAINAFAAGLQPSDAVIGVTRGCLHHLNRDELQGVIAHEFSHILNGDMRLNTRLIGWLYGILCLALLGEQMFRICSRVRTSGSDRKDVNPLAVILLAGLALVIIGYIGVFFARLIQSAVSRQREFLADAAAVQFTRNPSGLAGALKKIGGFMLGSKLQATAAGEAGHMFFASALSGWLHSLFATHPPLEARIRSLDPAFDGSLPHVRPEPVPPPASPTPPHNLSILPGPLHLAYAAALQQSWPDPLREAAHDPCTARALICALLLAGDKTPPHQRLAHLGSDPTDPSPAEILRLHAALRDLPRTHRLPLLDLCYPALRHLTPAQYTSFRQGIDILVEEDGSIDLFEYALLRSLDRHLGAHFHPSPAAGPTHTTLLPLLRPCGVLLSALAHMESDPDLAREAFQAGAAQLNIQEHGLTLLETEAASLAHVDEALRTLDTAVPVLKRNILYACATTASRDGRLAPDEHELIRAIADSLGCPLPPFVADLISA